MSVSYWNFRTNGRVVELEPPDGAPVGADTALADFIGAEIGLSSRNLADYRSIWERVTAEGETGSGVSGNGTSQTLDEGGNVVLEALFDQWNAVVITRAQFEEFLDQFADYLKTSETS